MPTLNLPTPGVTPGTAWATQLNTEIGKVNTAVDTLAEDTGWVDIPLETGILPQSTAERPMVRRIGKNVYVRGGIKSTDSGFTAGGLEKLIGVIPVGFRPAMNQIGVMASWTYSNRAGTYAIATNGNVVVVPCPAGVSIPVFWYFGGVSWPIG